MLVVTFLSVFIPNTKAQPAVASAYCSGGGYLTIYDVTLGYSVSGYDYTALNFFPIDDTLTFIVVPPTGYHVVSWYDSETNTYYGDTYTISGPLTLTYDTTVTFEADTVTPTPAPTSAPTPTPDPSTLTASASGSGGVFTISDITLGSYTTPTSDTVSLSFTSGDQIQFNVVPPSGYAFSYWSNGTHTFSANPLTQTLAANQALTAHYVLVSSGTYHYILHGPYIEDGNTYNGVINATVNYDSLPSTHYLMNGTSGTAQTLDFYTPTPITTITWNISASNVTRRVYYFANTTTFGELWLYVPDTLDPMTVTNSYGISVSDLAGLTNAYVQTTKNVEGYQRVIERQPLDPINPMPFWLVQFTQYNLVVTSDQGTFTFGLPADTIGTKNYAITSDMITRPFTGYNMTVNATRSSATNVLFTYYDPSGLTTQVYTELDYYIYGVWHVAYSQIDYSSTQSLSQTVDATTTYYVNVTAVRNGVTLKYVFILDPPNTAYQFDLTNGFNLFGTWPIEARNLLGIVIVLVFFGVGSYKDSEFFAGVSAVIALFLWAIGLLVIPVAAISMVLVIVAFMYLHKGKQEIREI
jgi:hypothetical protein